MVRKRGRNMRSTFFSRPPSVTPEGCFCVFCGKKFPLPSGQNMAETVRKPASKPSPCPRVSVYSVLTDRRSVRRHAPRRRGYFVGRAQVGRHAPRAARVLRAPGLRVDTTRRGGAGTSRAGSSGGRHAPGWMKPCVCESQNLSSCLRTLRVNRPEAKRYRGHDQYGRAERDHSAFSACLTERKLICYCRYWHENC